MLQVVEDIYEAQKTFEKLRQQGRSVGLVPTMGSLHKGHVSLVERARLRCDVVAVSIFVNAIQFNDVNDHRQYPRSTEADLAMLASAGVDFVLLPTDEQMHPKPMNVLITTSGAAELLEGVHRPGHFDGVATVVAKLFIILGPGLAFFGEKDFQQLVVVRRMVSELHFPVEIVGCPTVREPDGLAMSSRNLRLTEADRAKAPIVHRAILAARQAYAAGETSGRGLIAVMYEVLSSVQDLVIDYASVVDPQTLKDVDHAKPDSRLVVAVHLGSVRLIDNSAVGGD